MPTNGPLHERSYSPNFPGMVAEKVTYEMGDREEEFQLGNHTTEILVGDMTYKTQAGTFKAQAATSSLELSSSGADLTALAGNVGVSAPAGSLSLQAMSQAELRATGGPAIVAGSTMVLLSAPVTPPDVGPIITAGSREPFTNLPFSTWGLGARNHIIGS